MTGDFSPCALGILVISFNTGGTLGNVGSFSVVSSVTSDTSNDSKAEGVSGGGWGSNARLKSPT